MKKSDVLTINGETHTISEWCTISGISYNGMYNRLKCGWTLEEALTTPPQHITGHRDGRQRRTDKNCVDCKYSMRLTLLNGGIWYACDHLGKTGKCRPCESGDKCTVKIKSSRKKRPSLPYPL